MNLIIIRKDLIILPLAQKNLIKNVANNYGEYLSNMYGIDDSGMPVFHANTNQEKFIY